MKPQRIALLMCTLMLLLAATTVFAQTLAVDQNGRLVRFDPTARVIVLDDGRMFRVTPQTVVLVNEQPMALTALQPGQQVVVRSGEAVVLKDGQYVALTAPVVAAPTAAVVPMNSVRQTIYGKVTDVDRDGQITVKTGKGEFEVRMSPDAARTIKKGDTVTIDVVVSPPGAAPAASPLTR
jgi:ribosomal protein L14